MTTVFSSTFRDEYLVVKSLLESAGIETELLADGMLDSNPIFVMNIKGAQVLVPDTQAEDALAIVEDFRKNRSSARLD